jgi:hypothetical protein
VILAVALALIAAALLAVGVRLRWPVLAGAGMAALGLAEAVPILALHGAASALVAIPAAALLLGAGELCLGLADGVGAEAPGDRRRQAWWVCGCAVAAAATAFVVIGTDAVGFRRSAVATVAGAALAALAVWLLVSAVYALAGQD